MRLLCYLLAVVAAATGSVITDRPTSVINGEPAEIGDYPFYVYVETTTIMGMMKSTGGCGGTIIRPNIILTATHCIDHFDTITIYTGVDHRNQFENATKYTSTGTRIHKLYNNVNDHAYDVALIKLDRDITLGEKVQIATLSETDPWYNEDVVIIGFGRTECLKKTPNGECTEDASNQLRFATLHVTERAPGVIGATGDNDENSCQGDSGGPMVYNGKVVGVSHASGIGCALGSYYTSVVFNKEWIETSIQELAAEQPPPEIKKDVTKIQDYPFYVFLAIVELNMGFRTTTCAGTIIKSNMVLTATHCIDQAIIVTVYTGVDHTNQLGSATPYNAKNLFRNSLYNSINDNAYDVGLIVLDRDITFSETVQPAKLGHISPGYNEEVVIVGFGLTECVLSGRVCTYDGSKDLKAATVRVEFEMSGVIGVSGDNKITCHGEAGSPMLYNGEVVGVVHSTPVECGKFALYSSVPFNEDWLDTKLEE